MNWTKERQRWFNLVLMNAVAVKVWYSQRNKFNTDQLWFLTLPVFLIFFNGIFFAPAYKRRHLHCVRSIFNLGLRLEVS